MLPNAEAAAKYPLCAYMVKQTQLVHSRRYMSVDKYHHSSTAVFVRACFARCFPLPHSCYKAGRASSDETGQGATENKGRLVEEPLHAANDPTPTTLAWRSAESGG